MESSQKFLLTVRFPSWKSDGGEYPPFGVRYLISVPMNILMKGTQLPDEIVDPTEEDYEKLRTEEQNIKDYAIEKIEAFSDKFDGEILFVEPFDVVVL